MKCNVMGHTWVTEDEAPADKRDLSSKRWTSPRHRNDVLTMLCACCVITFCTVLNRSRLFKILLAYGKCIVLHRYRG